MTPDTIYRPQLVKPVKGDALSRSAALIRHNTIMVLREPGPLISRILMPLGFDIIMRPLDVKAAGAGAAAAQAGTAQAVTGSVVMFSMLAVGIVGSMIITERVWGTWDRVRATAVHPFEVLMGKAVPGMGVLLAQQVIILGFGILVQGMRVTSPMLLVIAVLAWTLALLGFGAAVGVLARSLSELSAAFDIGGIMLAGLGGAVVSLSLMPEWVRVVAPVSPGYWALAAMRGALQGDTSGALTASLVLLAFAAGSSIIVCLRIVFGGARSAKL
jgi:ABC-2 type transport system permease protein